MNLENIKAAVGRVPIVGSGLRKIATVLKAKLNRHYHFPGSRKYWETRYIRGDDSGPGSYGKLANFKANFINSFVEEHKIGSVIEFGCGDGNQLSLAKYPKYIGFDVSRSALLLCENKFSKDKSKIFLSLDKYNEHRADIGLSLDVIYHLVENDVFEAHMNLLFGSAEKYVIIYSSNTSENGANQAEHVRHRNFTGWISEHVKGWQLFDHVPNEFPFVGSVLEGSSANFYVYAKSDK